MDTVLLLLVFSPLWGAVFLAAAGTRLPRRWVEIIACLAVVVSLAMAILAVTSAGQKTYRATFFTWFAAGDFSASMSVFYDPLAAVMALMVTFVSSVILIYSVPFMRDDGGYVRYFCFMDLFVFAMLVITLADNILFMYLGWEGVGFCSYALIGFWYPDAANATAGRKAFILTRIGDVAFGIAISLVFFLFHQTSLSAINGQAPSLSAGTATALGILLLWAAVGKSAQLPLSVWLPDAMAGPTPVSALIHAATMVTAGVYLLMRFFPIISLSPAAMLVISIVGAGTAFFAALAALAQTDIKRVLAYSTISQVSYMLLGVGAGDMIGGMFHLLSHAFFKALLFLAAGCVIQALHDEHDIFRMGNLRRRLPMLFPLFLMGALSLGAIPPFGGFFSKDRILAAVFLHPEPVYKFLWALGVITAFLTSLYTFRLFFIVFLERPGEPAREIRPYPKLMEWMLWPLAILSIAAGLMNLPPAISGRQWLARYLAPVPGAVPVLPAPPALEAYVEITTGAFAILFLILAYVFYRPENSLGRTAPGTLRHRLAEIFCNGFYLDRLYQLALVRPYEAMSRLLWTKVDEGGIDAAVDQSAGLFPIFSVGLQAWTNGRISSYLRMIFVGFTAILAGIALGWYSW